MASYQRISVDPRQMGGTLVFVACAYPSPRWLEMVAEGMTTEGYWPPILTWNAKISRRPCATRRGCSRTGTSAQDRRLMPSGARLTTSMRFLVDNALSPLVAEGLRRSGHERRPCARLRHGNGFRRGHHGARHGRRQGGGLGRHRLRHFLALRREARPSVILFRHGSQRRRNGRSRSCA